MSETEILEKHLMAFQPMVYLRKYVTTVEDVANERPSLSAVRACEEALDHVLSIVTEALVQQKRFRRVECLRTIRNMVKSFEDGYQFSPDVITRLFMLFQMFVCHKNTDICAWVNSYLKGRRLSDEQVDWLITNYEQSDHMLNRLLRYPVSNAAIQRWATDVLRCGKLSDRKSELIAILISESFPPGIRADPAALAWAVHYSKASHETKIRLLKTLCCFGADDHILNIALRNAFTEVIEFMLERVDHGIQLSSQPT